MPKINHREMALYIMEHGNCLGTDSFFCMDCFLDGAKEDCFSPSPNSPGDFLKMKEVVEFFTKNWNKQE